jgi:non-specific serine/threonine protein kinase/serine/threonine-protein kinase
MTDDPNENGESTELEPMADGPSGGSKQQIGPYRLLEKLGEGGMGEVWLAEQTEPVKRKVALKIIKQGMDTKQVMARFEAERQALALMEHPSIAKVYDAGATPRGRPYFAMEHVQGVPITEHCDRHKLTNKQRLDLFLQVCEGVQHAHHKAVIHRDLKPSNVMVAIRDDKPVPKIIDFGVAKATAQKLTEQTMHTQLGVMIGTPAYMSPEQAEMTGQNVDTRTDVYALGVMLYELLVGALPFDMKDFRQAGLEGIVRKIREDEPPKPSTRLSTLGDESTQSAACRRTELPALKRELSGDLDWITLKALEKDRTRRYSSPKELARDIERYLTDEPVLASPPSVAYRARKFVRRHRTGVVAAGLVLVALIAGVSAGVYGLVRARQSEAVALDEAATAKRVSEFMMEIFREPSPHRSRGKTVTAMEILDRGAARIEEELVDQPRVKLRMMKIMGLTYGNLGLHDEGRSLLEESLAATTELYGADHDLTADRKYHLAGSLYALGEYEESERLLLEALETYRVRYGGERNSTVDVMSRLGWQYAEQRRFEEADPLLTEALELRRASRGAEHGLTLDTLFQLGFLRNWQGRNEEAELLHTEALEARRRLYGDESPATLDSMNGLAVVYDDEGRFDEAEALHKECLALKRRVLGNDHPITAYTTRNLGDMYRRHGRLEEAEPLLAESVSIRRKAYGEKHPETLEAQRLLGLVFERQGRHAEAETIFRQVLDRLVEIEGDDSPATLDARLRIAFAVRSLGRVAEGEESYQSVATARSRLDDDVVRSFSIDYNLACYAAITGRRDEAMEHLRRRIRRGGPQAWMLDDPDLQSLHGDPEFEEIFAALRPDSS